MGEKILLNISPFSLDNHIIYLFVSTTAPLRKLKANIIANIMFFRSEIDTPDCVNMRGIII